MPSLDQSWAFFHIIKGKKCSREPENPNRLRKEEWNSTCTYKALLDEWLGSIIETTIWEELSNNNMVVADYVASTEASLDKALQYTARRLKFIDSTVEKSSQQWVAGVKPNHRTHSVATLQFFFDLW